MELTSVADPRSGAFLTPGSGMVKISPDPGSGMNILDHFSENLEKFLGLKILTKFLIRIRDAGSGIFWPWIRDRKIRIGVKHPGFTTLELTNV